MNNLIREKDKLVQTLQEMQEKIKEDAKKLEEMTNNQKALQQEIQACTEKLWEIGNLLLDASKNSRNIATTLKTTKTSLRKGGTEKAQPLQTHH